MQFRITIILISIFIATPLAFLAASTIIDKQVLFSSQAPLGNWEDPRQQDGCEEAVVLMAMSWLQGWEEMSAEKWRDLIIELSDFQLENYGEYRDASLEDIKERLFEDYFSYYNTRIEANIQIEDIIYELEKGNIVLVPVDGQKVFNPNFSGIGPERHMILIKGFDYENQQFITHDPGTRNGKDYRYDIDILFEAIRPYKTGFHEPFD